MSAATDLGDLLQNAVTEPAALLDRVLSPVLQQLAPLTAEGELPAADRLATALGNRLAQIVIGEEPATIAELAERDSTLAAALGACECWGRHCDCEACGGAGVPGWICPDERLFAIYVRPAVTAFGRAGDQPRDAPYGGADNQREEGRDAHYLAR